MSVLSLRGIAHHYRDVRALDAVDLTLTAGVTALVGVNGAGKSTLMSVGSGALRPSAGSVRIDDVNPYARGRSAALRRVALMPQSVRFPANMTAREVVQYLTWMRGMSGRQAFERADAALEQVGLTERAATKVGHLSGGMVRRLALAQALAVEAGVVLLDEPSTGLDPEQRRVMVGLIGAMEGTVLMSSHVMEDVVEVAEQVIVLHDGQIAFHGSVIELQSFAPAGTESGRAAEVGFLQLIAGSHAS